MAKVPAKETSAGPAVLCHNGQQDALDKLENLSHEETSAGPAVLCHNGEQDALDKLAKLIPRTITRCGSLLTTCARVDGGCWRPPKAGGQWPAGDQRYGGGRPAQQGLKRFA